MSYTRFLCFSRSSPGATTIPSSLPRSRSCRRRSAGPSPATHANLAQLKSGETVHQVGELPKTLRVSKIHYEPPKTVCKIPFASIFPPSMENGYGTPRGEGLATKKKKKMVTGLGPSSRSSSRAGLWRSWTAWTSASQGRWSLQRSWLPRSCWQSWACRALWIQPP